MLRTGAGDLRESTLPRTGATQAPDVNAPLVGMHEPLNHRIGPGSHRGGTLHLVGAAEQR
jgi:hypothetical protein